MLYNKNIVVTGGAGFIGSHLVDKLVELGANVIVIDNLSFGTKKYLNKYAYFVKADVRDYNSIKTIIKNADVIYHLAAVATTKENAMGWKDPLTDYQVNAIGTLNILQAMFDLSIDPVLVYASSAAVYGNPKYLPINEDHPTDPISPYGVSKLAGEKYCLAYHKVYGVKTVILRIFNTYGPRQSKYVMIDLLKKIKENPFKLEVLGTGEQIRDYCYVSDVVDALILSAENKASIGETFNLSGGFSITIRELVEKLLEILGLIRKTKVYFKGKSWEGDITKLVANISKIREKLHFKPKIDLHEGLVKLIDWFYTEGSKNDKTF